MHDQGITKRLAALSPEKRALLLARVKNSASSVPVASIPRIEREDATHELSYSQQRLWFFDRLEPGSHVYNLTTAVRIEGDLDTAALEQSAQALIARHESLRTSFVEIDGHPFQRIDDFQRQAIEQIDLSALPREEREAELARLVTWNATAPFDLAVGPLFRITLVCLSERQHAVLVAVHHIISDGSSQDIFHHQLWTHYAGCIQGAPPESKPLPIRYIDYAAWQQEQCQGPELRKQLDYWKRHLDAAPRILDLREDYPRPARQVFEGGELSCVVPQARLAAMDALLQEERVTTFMVLLAVFSLQLSRISGQDDIVVGTPVAGRRHQEVEKLIGFFVNTVAARTKIDARLTFRELLRQVRQTVLDGFEHQDLPFSKLIQELQIERDLSRTPIFQVALNVLSYTSEGCEIPGLTGEWLDRPAEASKFDLTLYATPREEATTITLVYNRKLFSEARMEAQLEQFEWMLRHVIANPDAPLGSLQLVTDSVRARLPDPRQPLPVAIQELPYQCLLEHPAERTAIVDAEGQWSYGELERRSNQLARHLLELGVRKGEVVAIEARRIGWQPCIMLAIWKAGAATLVLDPAYPVRRLADCVKQAEAAILVTFDAADAAPSALIETIEDGRKPRSLTLRAGRFDNNPFLDSYSSAPLPSDNRDTDLAYVAFTSGSTGRPKGVLGTHAAVGHFVRWQQKEFGLNSNDRFGCLSGLSHDPLLRDVLAPLSCGATLVMPGADDLQPGNLGNWLTRNRISVAHTTPTMALLLNDPTGGEVGNGRAIESLRLVFLGGEALTSRHVEHLRTLAPSATIVNFYGTTETPQAMGYYLVPSVVNDRQHKGLSPSVPIGEGIADVQLLVLDGENRQCSFGELGEIVVRSPYLSLGYLGPTEPTENRFSSNPFTQERGDRIYRTGDAGRVRPDGQVEILGRMDRQLNLRGFRIEPSEVERTLRLHEQVLDAVVVAVDAGQSSNQLTAYLCCSSPALDLVALRAGLREHLPAHSIPASFILIDSIPRTPNGKIDYAALPDRAIEQSSEPSRGDERATELQEEMIEVWKRVLKTGSVGLHDDFFDLGGHSLLAVELFVELEKVTQRKLPLSALFQSPTIAGLSELIERDPERTSWSSLVAVQAEGTRSPFFCIHPLGGYALYYRDLAASLGADRPFYALQSPGLDGERAPFERADELAAHYLDEIKSVQPTGPYMLGGLCFGGVMAVEIARQLELRGEAVGLLALLDTYTPAHAEQIKRARSLGILWRRALQRVDLEWGNLSALPFSRRAAYLRGKFLTVANRVARRIFPWGNRLTPIDSGAVETLLRVQTANIRILREYVPTEIGTKITLFRATNQPAGAPADGTLGWHDFTGGGLDIHEIEGYHSTIAVDPNVGILAAKLQECLQHAEQCDLEVDAPEITQTRREQREHQFSLRT